MKNVARLIVLGHTKYSDHSLVLHTLSDLYGRRSFLVRVTGKNSMALFLPLNLLEAEVHENPKATLWRASSLSSRSPLGGIRASVGKNAMTLFMSEVLFRAIREEGLQEGLFEWCERSVLTLDALQSDWSNFHVRFLLELSAMLGFSPSEEDLLPFAGENAGLLVRLAEAPLPEAMLLPLSGRRRGELCSQVIRYLEYHTESSLNIRSLEILPELFR